MKIAAKILALALGSLPAIAQADPPGSLFEITPRAPGSTTLGLATKFSKQDMMYSKDGGNTFAALCKSLGAVPAVDSSGRPTTRFPAFQPGLISHDGHFIAGGFDGLWMDDGNGCGWHVDPQLGKAFVTSLIFDPTDPKIIYGVTATGAADNGLFRRNAEGVIERVGAQDELLYFGVRAAPLPAGGIRIYTLARRDEVLVRLEAGDVTILDPIDGGALPVDDAGFPIPGITFRPFMVLRYSDDLGETWTSHDVGVTAAGITKLAAVDPTNPDRVVLWTSLEGLSSASVTPDVVRVSVDRGATFQNWFEPSALGGIAFMPDGTVFVGEIGEGASSSSRGLWRASSVLDPPVKLSDYDVWCVGVHEGQLEVCRRFEWGTADPETGEFTERFSLRKIDAVHSCGGTDGLVTCSADLCGGHCQHWRDAPICAEHFPSCSPPEESFRYDAGASSDAGTQGMKPDGCGCRALGSTPGGTQLGGAFSVTLAGLFLGRRARRPNRTSIRPPRAAS